MLSYELILSGLINNSVIFLGRLMRKQLYVYLECAFDLDVHESREERKRIEWTEAGGNLPFLVFEHVY